MNVVVCGLFRARGKTFEYANEGLYTPSWADKLYRGFRRNLTGDFRFICLSDFEPSEFGEPAVEVVEFIHPDHVGTWMCLNECLRPDLTEPGDLILFTGLDSVITGPCDVFFTYQGELGLTSSPPVIADACNAVAMWTHERGAAMWEQYIERPEHWDAHCRRKWTREQGSEMIYWADECRPWEKIDEVFPGTIASWKHHMWRKSDEQREAMGASIVYMQGGCKQHKAQGKWLRTHWT